MAIIICGMGEYRAFILDEDHRVKSAVEIHADSDEKATEQAMQHVDGHDVELWQATRMIAVLKHKR